jgi:hypothetical protein
MLKVLSEAGCKFAGRCGFKARGFAHAATAQEFQQLSNLAAFATPGLGAN